LIDKKDIIVSQVVIGVVMICSGTYILEEIWLAARLMSIENLSWFWVLLNVQIIEMWGCGDGIIKGKSLLVLTMLFWSVDGLLFGI